MSTFQELQDYIEDEVNDTSQSSYVQTRINLMAKEIAMITGWDNAEDSTSISTVASQQSYSLPASLSRVISVVVSVGGIAYFPKPVDSEDSWQQLNQGSNTSVTSDFPSFYRVTGYEGGYTISLFPTPSSAGNTIAVRYYRNPKNLASGDFTDKTAGTITMTNGSSAIVGSGTSFAASDVGRFIKADSNGYWYKISSFTDSTNITLDRSFDGVTVSGGTYKLGTLPDLPESGHIAIAYAVLEGLWRKREDMSSANKYRELKEIEIKRLRAYKKNMQNASPSVHSLSGYLPSGGLPFNPNDYPTNITG